MIDAGISALRAWLHSDSRHGEFHPRLKVVALGHGSAGKTTLLRHLLRHFQGAAARRTSSSGEVISPAFSSLDADSYPRTLDFDHNSQVNVFDFPGQVRRMLFIPLPPAPLSPSSYAGSILVPSRVSRTNSHDFSSLFCSWRRAAPATPS